MESLFNLYILGMQIGITGTFKSSAFDTQDEEESRKM